MILCIDIGNTNIVSGLFKSNKLIASWRLSTQKNKTADEWWLAFKNLFQHYGYPTSSLEAIVISNVVPPLQTPFEEMCQRFFQLKPLTIGENLPYLIKINTHDPREVGADLVAEATAAFILYGGPVIVVDFGTATTFTTISKDGEFLGTVIAPGIGISAEALFVKAAKLPRIQIKKPPGVIGKNTIHSMQSGLFYGFVGQVEKIILQIRQELNEAPRVVATGGLASLIAEETTLVDEINHNLVLEGLRIIYEKSIKH